MLFHLIRHGENDWLRRGIAGRRPGVELNAGGRRQAKAVADFLASAGVDRLISSPLQRSRETAEPAARRLGLTLEISEAVTEVDFGDWTGRSLEQLETLEEWRRWNAFRSGSRIPNGESMLEVQARVVGEIERLRRSSPTATRAIAIFSHGDPIRAALVYYLGMPLDLILRLHVGPGTISTVTIHPWTAELQGINVTPGTQSTNA